jgi:RNA polymerase sigma factor (TIGR02999 family)
MSDVTVILNSMERGEARAEDLLPLVYDELRRLAAAHMHQERLGHTLQATALVHEAFLRLTAGSKCTWENRRHFFGAAAEAMRRILVEQARRKGRVKHGGDVHRIDLPDLPVVDGVPHDKGIAALDAALEAFEREDPGKAELVKLRFFAGLQETEAAQALGISRATASRWWTYAKAWLYDKVQHELDS